MKVLKIEDIVDGICTPSYVFDSNIFRKVVTDTREVLGEHVKLCYSIKANPFLLDDIFASQTLFDKLEVCSPGELRICMNYKIPPEMILFSGINKSTSDVKQAYDFGVRLFTVESLNHLESINCIGKNSSSIIPIIIRISADSQFGMDENEVVRIIQDRNKYENVKVVGVHYFTGTQKKNTRIISKEIEYLYDFCWKMKSEFDFDVENVEYGTGFNVEYFESDKGNLLRVEDLKPELDKLSQITCLTVEMGRYFAATCGSYFTKVVDCKCNNGTYYAVVDGGMNQLHYDGQIRSMKIPLHGHVCVNGNNSKEIRNWTVCGSICSTEDVICRDTKFENLKENDVIVFFNTGAYSFMEGMSTFLSREMPQIWAIDNENNLVLLRDFIFTDKMNCSNWSLRQ